MSEEKQVRDDSLEKTAGGADAGRMIYRFKCSCGNVVMMGKNEAPKFPCPRYYFGNDTAGNGSKERRLICCSGSKTIKN